MSTVQEQIKAADVAIEAAEKLEMYDVAAQIIAKRAALVRRSRNPITYEVEYYIVPRVQDLKRRPPTVLPVDSIHDEVAWFKRGLDGVTVKLITWGDPEVRLSHRLMLAGKDPVSGDLMRGYIYAAKKGGDNQQEDPNMLQDLIAANCI